MASILFLCTANQIRSPFAAAYFEKLLKTHHNTYNNWIIDSAGTWATPDLPAESSLRQLAPKWELNFSDHKTKQVDQKMLEIFDLILVMEKGQKEAIHYEFPQYAYKVHMLTEICKAPYDFPDPQGMDIAKTEKCLNEIQRFLELNFDKIYKTALNT